MLYIRADGNAEIGTGHIMRCLSIADAARTRGEASTFITADDCMGSMIVERGHHVICLHSVWSKLEDESEKLISVIRTYKVKKLLIDSYYVTDMLINYNCYADKLDYPAHYPDSALLLGCQYAPLRGEFQGLPHRIIKKEVQSVLVTVGGTDKNNIAAKLVKMAKTSANLELLDFHIIAGRFNPHIEDLKRLEMEYDGIAIHRNIQDISRLMLDCDIAISAGGSTLYELCACGLPAIVFAVADNQINAVNRFGDGCMINAGDIRENEGLCLGRILSGIDQLAFDYQLRCVMSAKGQSLVDGKGALRVADWITR
jgi:spore coat polysaccharide biosynthesis predicted glycosyltransferase SpsG